MSPSEGGRPHIHWETASRGVVVACECSEMQRDVRRPLEIRQAVRIDPACSPWLVPRLAHPPTRVRYGVKLYVRDDVSTRMCGGVPTP